MLAGLPEVWDEEGAHGAWAILSFPREEAPGLIHRAGPCSQLESGFTKFPLVLWREQAWSLRILPFSFLTFIRDPAFL